MADQPAPGSLSPLYFVYAVSRQVGAMLSDALVGAPLSPEQYAVYSAIREDQPVTPSALARRLGMPYTSLLDEVARIRRLGHVEKIHNPSDGRSYLLRLTDDGLAAHLATHDLFDQVDGWLRDALGDRRPEIIDALMVLQRGVGDVHARLQEAALDAIG